MNYGCIGEKLGHSFSELIHRKIGGYEYILKEIPEKELDAFMKARDFQGINVTIPYKQAVIPYLDEISETAEKIGAVNTIVNKDGKLSGYNTDFSGMTALIKKTGASLDNKKVVILGTGGTSKTAYAVAESLGAAQVIKAGRTGKDGSLKYEEIYKNHADAEIIINTTPCGMFPENGGIPADLDRFDKLEAVIDAIYNPLRSRLVIEAKKRGLIAEGGLYMLVAQAVAAAELFTGKKYGGDLTDRIYKELLTEQTNIVLIGMPGSGKTTIGRKLANKLEREYADTDEYIVNSQQKPITEIFAGRGEEYFRDLESDAVKDISSRHGLVISTGGGCVLRRENVDSLKQNGMIFFLDRPPEKLIPTLSRPLADSVEKIKKLYEQRIDTYTAAADRIIKINDSFEEGEKEIIKEFNGE